MRRPAKPLPAANPLGLNHDELEQLEALLDALPAPLAPPDISALDGFLVGVLLQPEPVPESRWIAWVHDFDHGRLAPAAVNLAPVHALVRCRHAELARAIAERQWFDPWLFELELAENESPSAMVLPWVAGLAAALECFPALLKSAPAEAREPLAMLYAHFDPADLEDVGELAELIDEIAPPETAEEAVEGLVRCTLLLADALHGATRPVPPRRSPRGR